MGHKRSLFVFRMAAQRNCFTLGLVGVRKPILTNAARGWLLRKSVVSAGELDEHFGGTRSRRTKRCTCPGRWLCNATPRRAGGPAGERSRYAAGFFVASDQDV